MDSKQRLFEYLHAVLVHFKNEFSGEHNNFNFHLAFSFHNLPLALARQEVDYDQLLMELEQALESHRANPQIRDWFLALKQTL